MLDLAHPVDAATGHGVIREACAQFLEQYSYPGAKRVGRAKGAIRAIYLSLMEWGYGHPQGWEYWHQTAGWQVLTPHWLPEPEPKIPSAPTPRRSGPVDPSAQQLWRAVLGDLQMQLPRPTFETWLKPTEGVADDGEVFVLEAPTDFAVEWLERRMFHALQQTLEKVAGRPVELRIQVRRPDGDE